MYFSVASTWKRLFARSVDGAISYVFFIPVGLNVVWSFFAKGSFDIRLNVFLLCWLMAFLYEVVFVWLFGATIGKWLFGLRVVHATSSTRRPSLIQSALRNLANQLSFFLSWAPFCVAFLRYDRRHLADWLAETRVVQSTPRLVPPRIRWIVGPLLIWFLAQSGLENSRHFLRRLELNNGVIHLQIMEPQWSEWPGLNRYFRDVI